MPRTTNLIAIALWTFAAITSAQAEGSKAPGAAAADWAKRAAGVNAEGNAKESAPETADVPSDGTDWNQRVISPIFSELVMLSQPAGFFVRFENTKSGSYIREAVPKGETVENWTQMITVTGLKDAGTAGSLTPQTFFDKMAAGFKRACPETFANKPLQPIRVTDGHNTFSAVASCGSISGPSGAHSETMGIIVVEGAKDYYTFQWAERGPASSSPLNIDAELWQARMTKFQPVQFCPIKPGEKAPYASCISQ